MFKILIDTCVWLDLAKDSEQQTLLVVLDELIERKEISLIVPETIISEFNSNKERIIKEGGKSLSQVFKRVKEAVDKFGDPKKKKAVLEQLNNVDHKIPTLGDFTTSSIGRIEGLLRKAEIISITDSIKLRASERAIQKKAPFLKNKNSFNDAVIIETYAECINGKNNPGCRFAFITHNKHDFSAMDENEKYPHADIKSYFSKIKSLYFIRLTDALHRIRPDLVSEIKFENEFHFEPRTLSELLEAENELINKIWYDRHKVREYKIETGKIKIIARKDFSISTSKNTIVKDIWEGARKSAIRIEKKYGRENLGPWTKFEWGMLNGKVSALRWMMGEDWDELYT